MTAVASSPRPESRPGPGDAKAAAEVVLAMQDNIAGALAEAVGVEPPKWHLICLSKLLMPPRQRPKPPRPRRRRLQAAAAEMQLAEAAPMPDDAPLPFAVVDPATIAPENILALSGSTVASPRPRGQTCQACRHGHPYGNAAG